MRSSELQNAIDAALAELRNTYTAIGTAALQVTLCRERLEQLQGRLEKGELVTDE